MTEAAIAAPNQGGGNQNGSYGSSLAELRAMDGDNTPTTEKVDQNADSNAGRSYERQDERDWDSNSDQGDYSDGYQDEAEGEPAVAEEIELKVNGQVGKFTRDEVVALAQKQIASEMKLDQIKAQAEELKSREAKLKQTSDGIDRLFKNFTSNDPNTIARTWDYIAANVKGMPKFEQVVGSFVDYQLQLSSMDPEQRAQLLLQQERAQLEAERRRIQEAEQRKVQDAQIRQSYDMIMAEVPKAMQSVGLPETPRVIRRIGEVWAMANDQGMRPTAMQVAQYVRKELESERYDDLEKLPDDEVLKRLPESIVRKINAASVKKVKQTQTKPVANPTAVKSTRTNSNGYLSLDEWRSRNRR